MTQNCDCFAPLAMTMFVSRTPSARRPRALFFPRKRGGRAYDGIRNRMPEPPGFLERRFELAARGTSTRTEVLAGFTTFLTMAYIILVNPAILGQAGMPVAAVAAATCLAAAFASILMGASANMPLALAPGMGLNAYFAFTVVRRDGRAVAGGPGLRLHLGRRLPDPDPRRDPPADHRRDPAASVRRGRRRNRPVHRLHRPQECRHRRLQRSDLGRARRPSRARPPHSPCSGWRSSPRSPRGRCAERS